MRATRPAHLILLSFICLNHQCALIIEAVRRSVTLVYFNETARPYITEGSDLNTYYSARR
jgi:hypothetical protein